MRWGIVSTGVIANKFAATLCGMQDPENELCACASRTEEAGKVFAEKYNIPLVFDSYEKMAESDAVDAVYVCTPNNYHAGHTRLFLEHGKHVLCEKPFTTNAQDAAELYALAEEKGLFLMEALWTYHLPLIQKVSQMVRDGVIGEPVFARADFGYPCEGPRRERKLKSGYAGGALLDIGIYNLAFANQMFGCDMGEFVSQFKLSEYGTDVFSHVTADYNGATCAMNAVIGAKFATEGTVHGTRGRIFFPDYQMAEKAVITMNDGTEEVIEMPFDVNGFEYQIRETTRCASLGLTESPAYTHAMSIQRMKELDTIRKAWGMKFEFEK